MFSENIYDSDKLKEMKFKIIPLKIYHYIVNWVYSNKPPVSREIDGLLYYYISYKKFTKDTRCNKYQVYYTLKKLNEIQYDNKPILNKNFDYKKDQMWVYLNPNALLYLVSDTEKNKELRSKIQYQIRFQEKNMNELFEIEKPKKQVSDVVPKKERIVNMILSDNSDIFKTRIPKDRSKQTKTYKRCCDYVQFLYDGKFGKIGELRELAYLSDKYFNTKNWSDTLSTVRGDWKKVYDLLKDCVDNYRLMFEETRVPLKKDTLPDQLDKWFFNFLVFGEDKVVLSYFIYSLKQPTYVGTYLSRVKASTIKDTLPETIQDKGEMLKTLAPQVSDGLFWDRFSDMFNWIKVFWNCDSGIRYWVDYCEDIFDKYYIFLRHRNIYLDSRSLDIGFAVDHNLCWVWFLKEVSRDCSFNKDAIQCKSIEDLNRLYRR